MGLTAADWIADPNCPCAPVDSYRIGRNRIVVGPAMKTLLGKARIWNPAEFDRAWVEPSASDDSVPYGAPPGGQVTGGDRWATIAVVQGGDGAGRAGRRRQQAAHCGHKSMSASRQNKGGRNDYPRNVSSQEPKGRSGSARSRHS
jgi:hypothetical protein